MADYNNDGFDDLFCTRYRQYPVKGPRLLFRNLGDDTLEELTTEAGPALNDLHASRGCALGDLDNDGDLDLLILNVNEGPTLLRSDAPPRNHWLKVKLIGTRSHRSAIGARVAVHYGTSSQMQELLSQSSYVSCNDPRLHFGLGAAARADVEVFWPSGLKEAVHGIEVDCLITLKEGSGRVGVTGGSVKPA